MATDQLVDWIISLTLRLKERKRAGDDRGVKIGDWNERRHRKSVTIENYILLPIFSLHCCSFSLYFAFTPTWFYVKMINNFYLLLQCFFGSSFFLLLIFIFFWFTDSDFRRRWRKITLCDRWDFFNETSHQMLSGAINSFTWYIRYFSFLLFLLILFLAFCSLFFGTI